MIGTSYGALRRRAIPAALASLQQAGRLLGLTAAAVEPEGRAGRTAVALAKLDAQHHDDTSETHGARIECYY